LVNKGEYDSFGREGERERERRWLFDGAASFSHLSFYVLGLSYIIDGINRQLIGKLRKYTTIDHFKVDKPFIHYL